VCSEQCVLQQHDCLSSSELEQFCLRIRKIPCSNHWDDEILSGHPMLQEAGALTRMISTRQRQLHMPYN
jgi:hypothetical protein